MLVNMYGYADGDKALSVVVLLGVLDALVPVDSGLIMDDEPPAGLEVTLGKVYGYVGNAVEIPVGPAFGTLKAPVPVDNGPTMDNDPLAGLVPDTDALERTRKEEKVYGPRVGYKPLTEVLFAVIPPKLMPLEIPVA